MVHPGRLKAPCEAAGQMDPLTVPSHDAADLMVKQVEEALLASSGDRQGPNDTSKADWSQMARARNPWRHAEPATGPVRGADCTITCAFRVFDLH